MELVVIAASFGAVYFGAFYWTWLGYFDAGLPPGKTIAGGLAATLAFWLAVQIQASTEKTHAAWTHAARTQAVAKDLFPDLLELFFFGTGLSVIAHALVSYVLLAPRTPFLVVGGGLLSAVVLTLWRGMRTPSPAENPASILLVGFDPLCEGLLSCLKLPVAGICGPCLVAPPDGVPAVGALEDFGSILSNVQPTDIVISLPDWENCLSAGELLRLRQNGTRIIEVSALYEKLFSRICCERLRPADLVLSPSLRGDSRTMAIQAVYNNLAGLALLVALAPLLILIAFAVAITGGSRRAIESIECAGFQYIPFRLQRFRTTGPDGGTTALGRILTRLHLVNLPQLINVVRGDMALMGPRPVRSEFATLLSADIPFYAHRFSVKPGLTGWAQVHLAPDEIRDTRREIEYDLYYVKAGSLLLDLEILTGFLMGGPAGRRAEATKTEIRVEGEA